MQQESWLEQQLDKFGAFITNSHLVLTSGKHSDGYINLRVLAGYTDILYEIGKMIVVEISHHEGEIAIHQKRVILVGPETMGRTLAEFTAVAGIIDSFAWCGMKKDAGGNDFAEWDPKLNFSEMIEGSKCYIIDDLLTTAKSVRLVKQLIEKSGGAVEGVVVVARRSPEITAEVIGVPWLHTLLDVGGFKTYEAGSCPLCEAKVPMRLRPGHGHEWAKDHPDYPTC